MICHATSRYIYEFSGVHASLKKGPGSLSGNTVDTIFLVCSIAGFGAVVLISLTLLLIAMDKIEV